MKIVHVITGFQLGGAESLLVDIVNEQVKTNEVTLIIINNDYSKELISSIDKSVNVILLNRKCGSRSIIPFIKLNWYIWKISPYCVHVHKYSTIPLIFPKNGRKLFLTNHALNNPTKFLSRTDCIFAISDAVKVDMLKRGTFNIRTIPNGIALQNIVKRSKHDITPGERMKIVEVARINYNIKGQDILINAIAILKERGYSNIEVDFFGIGVHEEELKLLAKEKGVEEKIHFMGLKDREYIYNHLKDYDLMCHPARCEGFGLSVAEGVAAMLPALVPNEGGPYEIIKHGELGYTFEMGNHVDCADKIEYIYNNYAETFEYTKKAFEYVNNTFSIKKIVKDYLDAYKS